VCLQHSCSNGMHCYSLYISLQKHVLFSLQYTYNWPCFLNTQSNFTLSKVILKQLKTNVIWITLYKRWLSPICGNFQGIEEISILIISFSTTEKIVSTEITWNSIENGESNINFFKLVAKQVKNFSWTNF